jgi:hypothetical protein
VTAAGGVGQVAASVAIGSVSLRFLESTPTMTFTEKSQKTQGRQKAAFSSDRQWR